MMQLYPHELIVSGTIRRWECIYYAYSQLDTTALNVLRVLLSAQYNSVP